MPGLEGMAEEKIPQDYLDYLRTIVLKNVDFYEVPPSKIIQSWRDEKNKDRFKGKMVDYKEAVEMSKVTKYKMISIKGDQKIITIDRKDLEKYLKQGYVIHEPLTEEAELKPVPSLEDSAKKHNVDIEVLKKQLEKGIQVEKEHTKDEKTAEKIALAHLDERPDYYDQLAKVEKKPVDEACWTGYKQVGLKKKGKRMVPNCVKEDKRLYIESIAAVKNKAEKTGMPYSILKQVYDRGMAAWKGGHRPGATQVQWALARVNSFVTKSSGTWGGADSDLAKKVKGD